MYLLIGRFFEIEVEKFIALTAQMSRMCQTVVYNSIDGVNCHCIVATTVWHNNLCTDACINIYSNTLLRLCGSPYGVDLTDVMMLPIAQLTFCSGVFLVISSLKQNC